MGGDRTFHGGQDMVGMDVAELGVQAAVEQGIGLGHALALTRDGA